MSLRSWMSSELAQHYPRTPARRAVPMTVEAALNERFSFQVGVRAQDAHEKVRVEVSSVPPGWSVRVRRVGYVPLWHRNGFANPEGDGHLPGLFPEPLLDESEYLVTRDETHAFYITVQPGRGATPGRYAVAVAVASEKGKPVVHKVHVRLHDVRIRPRRNFPVTNWFNAEVLMEWYGCNGYDKKFWEIAPAYFRDMAEHGQDMLSSPLLTWTLGRPTQLLRIERSGPSRASGSSDKDRFSFDFRDVKKWVDAAQRSGIRYFEWLNLLTNWNAAFQIPVYEGDPQQRKVIWRTQPDRTTPHYLKYAGQVGKYDCPDATSPESRNFLSQLLPAVHRFLSAEKLLDRSYFHIGDEPERENLHNYEKSRQMVREIAPWMKVMDAFCWMEYARLDLMDVLVPRTGMVLKILEQGLPTWGYYCGNPGLTHVQRLMDSSLSHVRMNGWVFYRFPMGGFLHWGYNVWYGGTPWKATDPFTTPNMFAWPHHAYGDCYVVYPGATGPVDSMRWEAFGDSLQEYALLQTLGVPRDDAPLRAIRDFDHFPVSEEWIRRARRHYLTQAVGRQAR